MKRVNKDGTPETPEQLEARKVEEKKREEVFEALRVKREYDRLHAVELSIETLRKEAAEKISEADKLERLFKKYPDLLRDVNRWNTVRYYSKTVNSQVDRFDIKHNCGCCNDSPLEVWPYLETSDGNVYSDPPCFVVGEKHWISGDVSIPGWKEKLRQAGIPEIIIGAVSVHFKKDSDERKEVAESDTYEDEP